MSNRPDPVTGDDVRGLAGATQGLTHSIDVFATKAELKTERDNRRVWIVVGLVVALILLGGGLYVRHVANDARSGANDARTAITELTANRDESRRAVCQSDNHFIENHDRLVKASVSVLDLLDTPDPKRTPEQQAAIDGFIKQSSALYEATLVAPRDCSPAGIDAFYATGGN